VGDNIGGRAGGSSRTRILCWQMQLRRCSLLWLEDIISTSQPAKLPKQREHPDVIVCQVMSSCDILFATSMSLTFCTLKMDIARISNFLTTD
jgi:hypothetical protein